MRRKIMFGLLESKTELFKKLTIFFMILFTACFYITTAGFFISWGLLAILAFTAFLIFKKVPYSKKDLWFLILAYPLGAFLNLFSESGFNGTLGFMEFDVQVLTLLILMILNPSRKTFKYIVYSVAIAGVIASFYSFYLRLSPEYYTEIYNQPTSTVLWRLRSLRTIINWGEALQFGVIIILSAIFWHKQKVYKLIFSIILGMMLIALFFSGSRSGALSVVVGFSIMVVFFLNKKLIVIFSILLITLMTLVYTYKDNYIGSRYYSLVDVKSNSSNVVRLAAWKEGFNIAKEVGLTGVGVNGIYEHTKQRKLSFSEEERAKWETNFPTGQDTFENSYLNVLVQNGIFYFLYFFGFIFYFMIKYGLRLRKLREKDKYLAVGIYASLVAFLVSAFFFGSIEGSSSFFFFFLLYFMVKFTDKEYIESQRCRESA